MIVSSMSGISELLCSIDFFPFLMMEFIDSKLIVICRPEAIMINSILSHQLSMGKSILLFNPLIIPSFYCLLL